MQKTKTLYLVRHAKSSWRSPQLNDRERPLNERGKRNMPVMANRLADHVSQPDDQFPAPQRILTSPAIRAHTTAVGIATALNHPMDHFHLDERLYFQGVKTLLNLIRGQSSSCDALMLVGHNPDLTDLHNTLCSVEIDTLPTCAIITLLFKLDSWQDLQPDSANLVDFDFPKKELRN